MLIHDYLYQHADHIILLMTSVIFFFSSHRYSVKASPYRGWCRIQYLLIKTKIFM